jgi:hypothetical protein
LPDGTVVDYALHGELINGTPFEVHDCAVVQTGLRPGNPP